MSTPTEILASSLDEIRRQVNDLERGAAMLGMEHIVEDGIAKMREGIEAIQEWMEDQ